MILHDVRKVIDQIKQKGELQYDCEIRLSPYGDYISLKPKCYDGMIGVIEFRANQSVLDNKYRLEVKVYSDDDYSMFFEKNNANLIKSIEEERNTLRDVLVELKGPIMDYYRSLINNPVPYISDLVKNDISMNDYKLQFIYDSLMINNDYRFRCISDDIKFCSIENDIIKSIETVIKSINKYIDSLSTVLYIIKHCEQ